MMLLLMNPVPSNDAKETILSWRRNDTRILETISIPLSSSSFSRIIKCFNRHHNHKKCSTTCKRTTTKSPTAATTNNNKATTFNFAYSVPTRKFFSFEYYPGIHTSPTMGK